SFWKLIEVALDQNGAESAEAHDLSACLDGAGRRASNASDVFMHVGGFQTVGRNERVNVEATRLGSGNRSDVDMADRSGWNPGKDVLNLMVRQRGAVRPAQDSDYVRSGFPTFLMPDESKIDVDRPRQS